MTKPRTLTVRIDADTNDGIKEIQERYGTPISEQIRRALAMWLEAQGVKKKTARPRVGSTRKRA
jgi:hypothetical protein